MTPRSDKFPVFPSPSQVIPLHPSPTSHCFPLPSDSVSRDLSSRQSWIRPLPIPRWLLHGVPGPESRPFSHPGSAISLSGNVAAPSSLLRALLQLLRVRNSREQRAKPQSAFFSLKPGTGPGLGTAPSALRQPRIAQNPWEKKPGKGNESDSECPTGTGRRIPAKNRARDPGALLGFVLQAGWGEVAQVSHGQGILELGA